MIHQALFPFKQYSVPLAKKIGIASAAYLQLLMEKYGSCSFYLTEKDQSSVGVDANAMNGLIDSNVIIRDNEMWKIDSNKLDELLEITYNTSDKRLANKELMEVIRRFVKHLRSKGKTTTVENILSNSQEFEDNELIDSLSYAMHNGHITFYRRDSKKSVQGNGQKTGVGSLTKNDHQRDYSSILKKED